jgi:hypothetical protein
MKNIKMLALTVMVCAMGVFSALAQNDKVSYFNGNEFSLSLGTSYTVDKGFNNKFDFNLDVGASYFISKYFGISADLPFYSNHDTAIDRASLALVARLPIKAVAPYLQAGSQYKWLDKDFDYFAAGGIEWRVGKTWGVYSEYRYTVQNFDNTSLRNGAGQIRAGISLIF